MQDFEDVVSGECVYMENSMNARGMSKGKIHFKFTSSKLMSLSNVLYVPSLYKILVFGIFLNKTRQKTMLEMTNLLFLVMVSLLGKDN